jgi:radical SAM superfamily enzyme YgiQ (UPF0313 family)
MEFKMANILLLNPNIRVIDSEKDHYSVLEHLGLGLLAACMEREGHEVTIIDAYAQDLGVDETIKKALASRPEFFGITTTYISWEDAIYIAEQISVRLPKKPFIFLGGEHSTYSGDEILHNFPFVNAVVRGEGEETAVEMLRHPDTLDKVAGLWYRNGDGEVTKNPDRQAIPDLDALPFARRDTLEYCKENGLQTAIGVLAQRGCHADCSFCNAHRFLRMGGGKVVRRRSALNVADELEHLYHSYYSQGLIEKLYFYDATFIVGSSDSKQWASALSEEILRRDIVMPFEIYLRGDSLRDNERDEELIVLLRKAGLSDVFIGIESFDQEALNVFEKSVSSARIDECLSLLQRHNLLGVTQGVIMFNPYGGFEGLRVTAEFLRRYRLSSFWNISQKLQLFPGVKLIDKLRADGLLTGYDGANKVFSYRFVDERVEAAAGFLNMNNEPVIIRDNSLPRMLKTTVLKAIGELRWHGISDSVLDAVVNSAEEVIQRNCNINVCYFSDVLDHFEGFGRTSDRILDKRKSSYLRELNTCLDDMERVQRAGIGDLHSFVASIA